MTSTAITIAMRMAIDRSIVSRDREYPCSIGTSTNGSIRSFSMNCGVAPEPANAISLGLMMNNAVLWSALQLGDWWWFVPPGVGIVAIVGALYVMNVGLDEVFNPRLREL